MGGYKHVCIDGNSRTGALFALGSGEFKGTRMTARGKFEERSFKGKEYQVKEEWRRWRDETREDAFLVMTPEVREGITQLASGEKQAPSLEKCPYDLSAFTVYGTTPRNASPKKADAYVRLTVEKTGKKVCILVLSTALAELVIETLGDYVRVGVSKAARVLAVMPGNGTGSDRKVSYRTDSGKSCQISCSQYAEPLIDMYGTHRRVYFDAELFNDAVILRPTGEVLD